MSFCFTENIEDYDEPNIVNNLSRTFSKRSINRANSIVLKPLNKKSSKKLNRINTHERLKSLREMSQVSSHHNMTHNEISNANNTSQYEQNEKTTS